jgi:hypothetical protein
MAPHYDYAPHRSEFLGPFLSIPRGRSGDGCGLFNGKIGACATNNIGRGVGVNELEAC